MSGFFTKCWRVLADAMSSKGTKPREPESEPTGEWKNLFPPLPPTDYKELMSEHYRAKITHFFRTTPLLCIDGSVNPLWKDQLAMGFPNFTETEITELMASLRLSEFLMEEEMVSLPSRAFMDPAYKHLVDELETTSVLETLIPKLAPEADYDETSCTSSVKMYGMWYTVARV